MDPSTVDRSTSESREERQRRRYLVSRRFQLRFALQVLLLLTFTSVVIGWTVYYPIWRISEHQLRQWVATERISPADAQAFHSAVRAELGRKLFPRFLLLLFISFVFTVFATHRIAGPILRMEESLRAHLKGRRVGPIRLRRGDEFHRLAGLINRAMEWENDGEDDGKAPQRPRALDPKGSD